MKTLKDWEKLPGNKTVLIPHGFRLNVFRQVEQSRVAQIKKSYQLEAGSPVVGVISRFTEWKGVQYIIPAFKKLLSNYPEAVLVLYGADGDSKKEIMTQLASLPKKNFRVISFEKDIAAAYQVMNIFIHVPIDEHSEAFGQTYVEALASGVPSIFTLSGIAPDFITDQKNALVVPFKNSEAIYQAMLQIFKDKSLQESLRQEGYDSVIDKFDLSLMINKLEALYES